MLITLLRLFFEFCKIGLFMVGGGLATIPFLYELSDKTGWFSHMDIVNMIAVSESTPGPIGINMATYTGYSVAGILGAIIASLGIITPALIIVLIIASILNKYAKNKYLLGAFYGIRPASMALIAAALFSIIKLSLLNLPAYDLSCQLSDLFVWKAILMAAGLFALIQIKPLKKLHPIVFLAISAFIGVIFRF